ncbi:hypothetical protein SISSUDRAFT_1043613 [Sistotremastrum suecicum HHB10207 ss-3]|uniref:Uncharacterized protein n=1 Tax=Sistotremastrum suecicum HHB10207 ss-3 TaxID=1314776 RepID=A0A166FPI6_9AGAM|nr:hypothetical protein SISSUDRAFT_1043613 [Sistotremastrum suecicum HHB10207 ss-3]
MLRCPSLAYGYGCVVGCVDAEHIHCGPETACAEYEIWSSVLTKFDPNMTSARIIFISWSARPSPSIDLSAK